jgi:citrate/tricarballylate utilization protein
MPYEVMASAFGILAALACVPLAVGPVRFWRDTGKDAVRPLDGRALLRGLKDAISLRYLSGGGGGCISAGDAPSQARRWFHHLTFYGFLLCLASTTVAAVYHNLLGREAPYAFASAPVVLGCAGGLGLLVGPAGLLWLKAKRRAGSADPGHAAMDVAFLVLLALTSLTGFLLLLMRESAAMGSLLGIHLGTVAGLFLSLPYSKFVHAGYRFCALVRNAMEEGGGR